MANGLAHRWRAEESCWVVSNGQPRRTAGGGSHGLKREGRALQPMGRGGVREYRGAGSTCHDARDVPAAKGRMKLRKVDDIIDRIL